MDRIQLQYCIAVHNVREIDRYLKVRANICERLEKRNVFGVNCDLNK